MARWVPLALSLGVAAALTALADGWLQPVPLPAALATAAGAVVLGWPGGAGRVARAGIAATIGLLLGGGVHAWVHLTGRSAEPLEGLQAHVGLDLARSAGLALAGLLAVWLARLSVSAGRR